MLQTDNNSKYLKKFGLNLKKLSLDFYSSNLIILFRKNEPEPPSVVWRLFLMFRFEILSATAIKILSDLLQLANPFFLKYAIFWNVQKLRELIP